MEEKKKRVQRNLEKKRKRKKKEGRRMGMDGLGGKEMKNDVKEKIKE